MAEVFDVAVIGGGPGGYVAALKAAAFKLKVALVEGRSQGHLGGTCLNVGCIPTKSLLESAKTWHKLQGLSSKGFHLEKISFDWSQFLQQKNKIVDQQRRGLHYLMKSRQITVFSGWGSLQGPGGEIHEVQVKQESGDITTLTAHHVVLATGSHIQPLPHLPHNGEGFFTSDTILDLPELPKSLVIVGGGVIGMEFASLFSMLGVKVTVMEAAARILTGFDEDLVTEYLKYGSSLPMSVHTSTLVTGWKKTEDSLLELTYESASKNKAGTEKIKADKVLVCVGRKPTTQGLNLEAYGIGVDERGFISVDAHYRTSVSGVYAIGDVIATPSLAHSATAEGLYVAELIQDPKNPPPIIKSHHHPLAIYTYPELASVGWSESQLKEKGIKYEKAQFPFSVMGKAKIAAEDMGFVKVLSVADSKEILGFHVVGARATEMISEATLAMLLEGTLEEFAAVIRPHPTLSEILTEVAHSALGDPLHL